MNLIADHFGGLGHFDGRERRQPFWLWVLVVMASAMVVWGGYTAVFIFAMLGRVDRFAREHPDQVERSIGPGGYSVEVKGFQPELAPDFTPLVAGITIIAIVVVLLLAAAVARRLHDSGRSGGWGLLPLPFLFGGFGGMAAIFSSVRASAGAPSDGIFPLFGLLFLNNLIYLGALLTLVVLCCRPTEPRDNRYGPAPS